MLEICIEKIESGHPQYVSGLAPDLVFPSFPALDVSQVKELGSDTFLLDVDGTTIPMGAKGNDFRPSEQSLRVIRALLEIGTVHLATDNGVSPERLLELHGLREGDSRVFQPFALGESGLWANKSFPNFWNAISYELDLSQREYVGKNPKEVIMIGDSPCLDIEPASDIGLRTILVGRLAVANRPQHI